MSRAEDVVWHIHNWCAGPLAPSPVLVLMAGLRSLQALFAGSAWVQPVGSIRGRTNQGASPLGLLWMASPTAAGLLPAPAISAQHGFSESPWTLGSGSASSSFGLQPGNGKSFLMFQPLSAPPAPVCFPHPCHPFHQMPSVSHL